MRRNQASGDRRRPRAAVLGAVVTAVSTALAVTGCGSGVSAPASSPAAPTADAVITPVLGSVLYAPVPVEGSDARIHLVYELLLTNYTGGTATVEQLDVLDESTGAPVTSLDAAELGSRMQPNGSRDASTQLTAGQSGTVFLHASLAAEEPLPADLVHEVTVTLSSAAPGSPPVTERIAATPVDRRTLPVLSPPLAGQGYIAADGCCDAVRHTRAILPINGERFLAQRYAIDYEQVDDADHIYVGDRLDPRSYFIYGDEALAVADGTVVVSLDGLPEQVPGTYPEGIPIAEADGNSVVIDIGDGFFVNYAHFQTGSVRVKVGDRVRTGDVLGIVGNSGNSVAPHLHVHVMDGPSPLASQGLPYLVDAFTVTAQVASTADFDASEGTGIPLVTVPGVEPSDHRDQMVLDQNVVTFGG